jgi:predicted lipoprotein with Yx(FWY)xxD motif
MALAGLSVLSACSSPPLASRFKPGSSKDTISVYAYQTSLGQVVGSFYGIVAYTNTAEQTGHFACTSQACTATWHPWVTFGAKLKALPGVQQSMIGTVKRPDGNIQMTYGGHPLYLYAHTKHAVRANAQGAGGVWYVVGTDGNIVK